jgi:hypothetical protein
MKAMWAKSELLDYVSNAQIYFLLYVSMVFSKEIFSAIYMKYIKRFCPHSVSRILPMHIPAPNPNLFASENIPVTLWCLDYSQNTLVVIGITGVKSWDLSVMYKCLNIY